MSKTALITGMDTSLVAKSICTSLLQSGYEIVATSEGQYQAGTEVRLTFDAAHADFVPVTFEMVDFLSPSSVAELLERLSIRAFDVIVNCLTCLATTGEGSLRNEFADFDYEEFSRVLQYNVTAVAAVCIGLKDQIRPGGAVINVTSSAADEGAFATISYNASKAAVNNLTKSLANTLGSYKNIHVNSIAPGWIPPSAEVAAEGVVALANSITPLRRAGTAEDVVAAVHYLINAPFQNGSVLAVDGGITSSYLVYMLEALQLQGKPVDESIGRLVAVINRQKQDSSAGDAI